MCGGGTLPFLATASINANCPCVSSAVARKVISQPLYQTDRSKDCRPRPNAMDSLTLMFTATCVAMTGSFRFEKFLFLRGGQYRIAGGRVPKYSLRDR